MAKSIDPSSGLQSMGMGLTTPMGGATSTVSDLTAIGGLRGWQGLDHRSGMHLVPFGLQARRHGGAGRQAPPLSTASALHDRSSDPCMHDVSIACGTTAGPIFLVRSSVHAAGTGRGTVLGLKLDRMADSVTGQTVVDPKGYLTDLKSVKISTDAEISDIKKARHLLKSVIQTNPRHAPGWIAAAR